jgi:hypothetical protein
LHWQSDKDQRCDTSLELYSVSIWG